jgi:hypothetical protein
MLKTLPRGVDGLVLHTSSNQPKKLRKIQQQQAHDAEEQKFSVLPGEGHSTVLKEKEFTPWAPFANHHHSLPFQVSINC